MSAYLGEFEQLLLLALLRLGPGTGTPAIRDAVADGSRRTIWLGAVFTTLERLEAKGLVASTLIEPDGGGRRRRTWTLAPAGEQALGTAYDTWTRMTRGLEPRLENLK